MQEPTENVDPPPPEDPFAGLDAREALFTGALEAAARAEHLAAALRVQVMLAGFDAMLVEEAEQSGRDVRSDDPVVRSFLSHQAMTLHLTRQDVETRLEHARILRDRLPETWAVFTAGATSERVAGVAANQSIGLPDECLPRFDEAAAVLVQEARVSVVDRKLEQLRNELAPEAAIERAERRANRRHVTARRRATAAGYWRSTAPPSTSPPPTTHSANAPSPPTAAEPSAGPSGR